MVSNKVLAEELDTLKKKVQLLEGKEEIMDVLARYAFNYDLHRTENFLKLWTDDLIFIRDAKEQVEIIKGKDALRKIQSERRKIPEGLLPILQHLQLDYHIDVDGDTAVATGYQLIPQRWDGGYGIRVCTMRQFRLKCVDGRWLIHEAINHTIGEPACHNLVSMEL